MEPAADNTMPNCTAKEYLDASVSMKEAHFKGQTELIIGCMWAGKSSEMLRRIKRYKVAKKNCVAIKYAGDNRYSDSHLCTHDKQLHDAISAARLLQIKAEWSTVDVIGVDEGQFFPDLVPFCEGMANQGKIVIVAALDGTFERRPFPSVMELIPLAESVQKLDAVCMACGGKGAFTKRLGEEKDLEVIGGADKYQAQCRRCFLGSSPVTTNT